MARCSFCHGAHRLSACPNIDAEQYLDALLQRRQALAKRAFAFALAHDDIASQPRIARDAAALVRLDEQIAPLVRTAADALRVLAALKGDQ